MKNPNYKRELLRLFVFIVLFLSIVLPVNNWLNTSETITVMASTPQETPEPVAIPVGQATTDVSGSGGYLCFEKDAEIMEAIALAEHRGSINPEAVNSTEVEHSVGVFQINLAREYGNGRWVHWAKVPGDTLEEKAEWLKDPHNNCEIAKIIKDTQGLTAWSVYSDQKYLEYLNDQQR